MRECKHCKGTGVAPDKITLECIGCQRKVVVTYSNTAELAEKAERVLCGQCR